MTVRVPNRWSAKSVAALLLLGTAFCAPRFAATPLIVVPGEGLEAAPRAVVFETLTLPAVADALAQLERWLGKHAPGTEPTPPLPD